MNPEIFAKELAKYGFELNEKQQKQFATYYDKLVDDAVETISKYGDFEWFVSDDPYIGPDEDDDKPPWED